MEQTPSKLMPALIGGATIAILSSTPIINFGNCLCCMWIIFGGGLSAYLYSKKLPPEMEFSTGDGAISGLLAGIFGALLGAFLSYFLLVVVGLNFQRGIVEEILKNMEEIPPEFDELMEEFDNADGMSPTIAMIGLVSSMITNTIFGTIGGILSAAIFKKKTSEV